MSYAMKSRCALDNQCNAAGVLVVIMGKSAKDGQHPFQQRSGMICLCQIRKTTSTVVILQAGPWAFSWLTLCSTESCSTLSESLWTCSVLFANQNFSFRIIVSRICTLQSEKTVCMEYKNESGNFRKERMARNSAWLPVFAVPSYGNYSFCSCNPLGQSFVNFLS